MQTLSTFEIKSLFEKARKIEQKEIIIYYRVESENTLSKFAVAVPKRKIKKAVKRNRVKRQIRAIIRQGNFFLQKDIHLSFLVYYNSEVLLEYQTIKQQIEEGLLKILQKIQ